MGHHKAELIQMDFELEIVGVDGSTVNTTAWSIEVDTTTTWTEVSHGILTMVKECDVELPENITTAVFALEPNQQYHLLKSDETPERRIFMIRDHIDPMMLVDKTVEDLHNFNPNAKAKVFSKH